MSDVELMDKLNRIEQMALLSAKNVIDIDDAVVLTGYSRGHIYRLTSTRQIPHYKQDRKVFFKRAELEAWMTSIKVKTTAEISAEADAYTTARKNKARNGYKLS